MFFDSLFLSRWDHDSKWSGQLLDGVKKLIIKIMHCSSWVDLKIIANSNGLKNKQINQNFFPYPTQQRILYLIVFILISFQLVSPFFCVSCSSNVNSLDRLYCYCCYYLFSCEMETCHECIHRITKHSLNAINCCTPPHIKRIVWKRREMWKNEEKN